jgi:hypothetical protein
MTPKEKAEELVNEFETTIFANFTHTKKSFAKECALFTVNKIIDALETYDDMTEKHLKREFPNYLSCELQNMEQDFRYYEQVKQEIENL